ncbi:MAG: NADAR family protein [Alphaproteobacteria bacterium]|nr:NADAR family protein [Alphaproteobacteria bacterium]
MGSVGPVTAPVIDAPTIDAFDGEHSFLSNFYAAPVEADGLLFPTVEHAFHAAKTLDPAEKRAFTDGGADEAKRRGRQLALRPDWDAVRIGVMEDLLRQKFAIAALRRRLLATGEAELVEGNWWGDHFWGVCKGEGRNELGKALMRLRAEITAALSPRT